MADKYDEAIAYLKRRQDRIAHSWMSGGLYSVKPKICHDKGACLFSYVRRDVPYCLTMVKHEDLDSDGHPWLSDPTLLEIHADERIPDSSEDITVDHLPVFAEWQRRLDAELGEDRNGA